MEEHVVVGAVRQAEVLGVDDGKASPVSHVVDVENSTGVLVTAVTAVVRRHDERHEPHHPVVDEEGDVVAEGRASLTLHSEGSLQCRPREECETHEVVVMAVHAVTLVAPLLHKDVIHTAGRFVALGWHSLTPLTPVLHAQLLLHNTEFLPSARVLDALVPHVQRRHRHNAVSKSRESDAKLLAHVRQAPRLREGGDLRGDDDDVEALLGRRHILHLDRDG
mmetsp:Transcript_10238/g.20478  ORF Transcript_10238/g.20478 Transcript_10238/m.20478 type:complete len:221 (+) Transcript_10238:929-1591(+)